MQAYGSGSVKLRYLSLCSGIEAASVAWGPLGWTPVAFAEIEPFPCAVLAHHFPDIPNLGDMTKIDGRKFKGKVDVLVAGTPCQAFSVAGQRRGLDDERGNLTLKFVEIADAVEPLFILWENVPGVLSMQDNAFGCFLGGLAGSHGALESPGGRRWADAGCVFGPRRAIAWRLLDAQYFGLAQRRKRIFVVACPRGGADPTKILFEWEGLRRDSAPCRKKGQDFAGAAGESIADCSGQERIGPCPEIAGTMKSHGGKAGSWINNAEMAAAGYMLPVSHWEGGSHPTLNHCSIACGGIGMSNQELFSQKGADLVPAYEPLAVRTAQTSANGHGVAQEITHTLDASNGQAIAYAPPIVEQAISCKWAKGSSGPAGDEHHNLIVAPLTSKPYSDNDAQESKLVVQPNNTCGTLCASGAGMERVAGQANEPDLLVLATQQGGAEIGVNQAPTINAAAGMSGNNQPVLLEPTMCVRRLMPIECERLQGFPDNWTNVPFRGRPAADSPRYRAIGNSMAVPVIRWLGERIIQGANNE